MAFHTSSGLFKTAGEIAAEERTEQFKGTQGWESVGVGLGRLFSGPSDAELKAQQLNTVGDDLVVRWNQDHPTNSWDNVSYLNQLIYSEEALRKKGYGEEANSLYDEILKRSKEERASATAKRAAAPKPKTPGKGPSSKQFGTTIDSIKSWMTSVSEDMSASNFYFDFDWSGKQTAKVETAFGVLQTVPGMTEAGASSILRKFAVPDDPNKIDPDLIFNTKGFNAFIKKNFSNAVSANTPDTVEKEEEDISKVPVAPTF